MEFNFVSSEAISVIQHRTYRFLLKNWQKRFLDATNWLNFPSFSILHIYLKGVCTAVTLFSLQTKFDFTKCSGLLFVLVLVLFFFGFITIFTWRYSWVSSALFVRLRRATARGAKRSKSSAATYCKVSDL